MTPRAHALRQVASKTLDEMQRDGWYHQKLLRHDRPTAWDINNGMCAEWAEWAEMVVGGEVVDLAALKTELFGLPEGIFADVAHTVLLLDNRFYDAQDIDGVDDPRDLQLVRGVSRETFIKESTRCD